MPPLPIADADAYLRAVEQYYSSADRPYQELQFPGSAFRMPGPAGLVAAGARTLVLGSPGSGKSTLLDWTAQHAATTRQALPVFVSLRNHASTLADLIKVSIERFSGDEATRTPLSNGSGATLVGLRAAFLLDGLDEVPPPSRELVEGEIQALATAYADAAITVSSRERPSDPGFRDWVTIEIPALTAGDISAFLSQTPDGMELLAALTENPQLMALAGRPVFLHTLRGAWQGRVNVRDYLMRMLPRYTAWRGHTKSRLPTAITAGDIDQLLNTIALDVSIRGEVYLSLDRLRQLATQRFTHHADASAIADAVLGTDVIVIDAPDQCRFAHMSLMESYAARALVDRLERANGIDTAIMAVLASPVGPAVIRYFINLLSDSDLQQLPERLAPQTVEAILRHDRDALADRLSEVPALPTMGAESVLRTAATVARFAAREDRNRRDILVVAVHGFNTRGDWKNRLGLVLTRATDGERFIYRAWDYGPFRLGILSPCARRRQVAKFQDFYNGLLGLFPSRPEVVIVAHSFGSYIVGHALRRFPEVSADRLLLLGSALPRAFDWTCLNGRCGRVLNILGGSDKALTIARLVPGLGDGGRKGFLKVPSRFVQTREGYSEHSDLFGDGYMSAVWLPFLRDGSGPGTHLRPRAA